MSGHAYWAEQLAEGLQAMHLPLEQVQQRQLLHYLALLEKWNRAYNLTAIRDPRVMVAKQLLDSLSIQPWLQGPHLLDVGTGPGLPGLPLALANPRWQFTLLDSNRKKMRFLNQVVLELEIPNVRLEVARVEQFHGQFSCIVSRAFASLGDFWRSSRHLLEPNGCWLAMKGRWPQDELNTLPSSLAVDVHPLYVPHLQGQRHLVVMQPLVEA